MSDKPIKAVVSVAEMCRLLGMSRREFMQHGKRGTFHETLRLEANNRPYYTASMVEDNVQARATSVGVNGEYVLFYDRKSKDEASSTKTPRRDHAALIDGLKALGLSSVTASQIEAAMAACFPSGTANEDENAVLRAVFRHLKRSGNG